MSKRDQRRKEIEKRRSIKKKATKPNVPAARGVLENISKLAFLPLGRLYVDFEGHIREVDSQEAFNFLDKVSRAAVHDEDVKRFAAVRARYNPNSSKLIEIAEGILNGKQIEELEPLSLGEKKIFRALEEITSLLTLSAIDFHLKRTPHHYCIVPEEKIPNNLEEMMNLAFLDRQKYLADRGWFSAPAVNFRPTAETSVHLKPYFPFKIKGNAYKVKVLVSHSGELTEEAKNEKDILDIELLFTPDKLGNPSARIVHYHTKRPVSMKILVKRPAGGRLLCEMEYSERISLENDSRIIYRSDAGQTLRTGGLKWNFGDKPELFGGHLIKRIIETAKDARYEALGMALRKSLITTAF